MNTHLSARHRRDVFLDHQLDRVRHRLEDAVRTDAHRPESRLRPRDHLALEQHHIGDGDERRVQHNQDLEKRDDQVVDHDAVTTFNAELAEPAKTFLCVFSGFRVDRCSSGFRHRSTSPRTTSSESDQRHDVGDEVAANQRAQALQVAERRRPHAEAVRVRRLAVADDEVAQLAFRRLDGVIGLPCGRLDQARHLADDRSSGMPSVACRMIRSD